MRFEPLAIAGCFLIHTDLRTDVRGSFTKTFNQSIFAKSPIGLFLDFPEDFYSLSKPGVLRGLHFQKPPAAHHKLVFCLKGQILDVGVDLRAGSLTYGQHIKVELAEDSNTMLFLPKGFAHGFYVPRSGVEALVYYKVTSEYDPKFDTGIHWRSVGIDWPDMKPIVSERDQNLSGFKF